jgi:predicted nucleotidyltransferase
MIYRTPQMYRFTSSFEGKRRQMSKLKFREGDFIETIEGLFFDVKGLVHPPSRIVAFIRYFPVEKGSRNLQGSSYNKIYSFSDRFALLKENYPQYLLHDPVFDEDMCEVPTDHLKRRYDPIVKLKELRSNENIDPLENKALKFAVLLKEKSKISWSAIGISGSILVGLHNANSDIDLIIYGSENCTKVNLALKEKMIDCDSVVRSYDSQDLRELFDFRSKDNAASFADFVRTESRKAFQGKFMDTDYFIRFVKDWNEIDEKYGDIQYKNLGRTRIKANVIDDSESIFTPCKYSITNVTLVDGYKSEMISEIASFRGRFCEQAKTGEKVVAQGKVEKVTDLRTNHTHFRLLIGNSPSDCMVLA